MRDIQTAQHIQQGTLMAGISTAFGRLSVEHQHFDSGHIRNYLLKEVLHICASLENTETLLRLDTLGVPKKATIINKHAGPLAS